MQSHLQGLNLWSLHVAAHKAQQEVESKGAFDPRYFHVLHCLKWFELGFQSNHQLRVTCLQYGLQKRCLHHFQVNDVQDKPIVFHGCPQAHKYGMVHLVFYLAFHLPLVHTVARPCHVSIGTHTDLRSISLGWPFHKWLPRFAHYVLQTVGRFVLVQLIISSHKRYTTSLYVLYG